MWLLAGLCVASTADAKELYVANLGADSVTVYDRSEGGNAVPVRTLAGPATLL